MIDWRELYEQRKWDEIDTWWRGSDDLEGAAALLQRLRADVPRVVRRNGMEEMEDYAHPDETPPEWKGAAKILLLDELAALVEGDPEPVPDEWRRERTRIVAILSELAGTCEDARGDATLSCAAHVREALDALARIDFCTSAASNEIDPDEDNPDDREWLRAFAEEIAYHAFHAGIHARAAIGKTIEFHAVRGYKTISSAKAGGRLRAMETSNYKRAIVAAMNEQIAGGHTKANAARIVAQKGMGASEGANRKLWYSSRKRPA